MFERPIGRRCERAFSSRIRCLAPNRTLLRRVRLKSFREIQSTTCWSPEYGMDLRLVPMVTWASRYDICFLGCLWVCRTETTVLSKSSKLTRVRSSVTSRTDGDCIRDVLKLFASLLWCERESMLLISEIYGNSFLPASVL